MLLILSLRKSLSLIILLYAINIIFKKKFSIERKYLIEIFETSNTEKIKLISDLTLTRMIYASKYFPVLIQIEYFY